MPTNFSPDLISLLDSGKFYVAQAVGTFQDGGFSSDLLIFIKKLSLFISIVFGVAFIILVIKLRKFVAERLRQLKATPVKPDEGGPLMARWEEIKRHIDSDKEAQWKLAVIEADALVNNILEKAGYPGETMGEKLMLITRDQIQSIDGLWFAHKIRNQIAHNPEFKITQSDSIEAITNFEKVLKELHVLQ
ncbi:MAG: hypothetical protein HYW77_02630 [Parcubacteria group bacterium]|nr:hypothetical protein [Parcubacteria group bacterium]